MLWEMARHMHGTVFPSIQKHFTSGDGLNGEWDREGLESAYVDVLGTLEGCDSTEEWDALKAKAGADMRYMSSDAIMRYLGETAIEYGTTTNGACEFYLADKWTTIKWCTEMEMLEWWACE